jgi:hypothetical protein
VIELHNEAYVCVHDGGNRAGTKSRAHFDWFQTLAAS